MLFSFPQIEIIQCPIRLTVTCAPPCCSFVFVVSFSIHAHVLRRLLLHHMVSCRQPTRIQKIGTADSIHTRPMKSHTYHRDAHDFSLCMCYSTAAVTHLTHTRISRLPHTCVLSADIAVAPRIHIETKRKTTKQSQEYTDIVRFRFEVLSRRKNIDAIK